MKVVRVPGDKSITHRALILGALADGNSRIAGPLDSADTRSTAAVLRKLGVHIGDLSGVELSITGRGLRGLHPTAEILDCGNSGTTSRLMMGVLAAHPFASIIDGDESLRTRPMRRVTEPLVAMGARARELGQADRLPIEITGAALRSIDFFNDKSSAQVKSALMLAGLCAGVPVRIAEPLHSRDHTERMLQHTGVDVRTVVDATGMRIELDPAGSINAFDLHVPGDFSSAAFFLALGLLGDQPVNVRGVGVNATRTGFFDVVRRMQGSIHVLERRSSCNEPVADLVAEPSRLHATAIEAAEIPGLIDEVPMLAVLAARAEGETVITGAHELRAKETDRLRAVAENLRTVGVSVEEQPDGLKVTGTQARLSGHIRTFGDHRIAMAFAILGAAGGDDISLDDAACVDVSFPSFWEQLEESAK